MGLLILKFSVCLILLHACVFTRCQYDKEQLLSIVTRYGKVDFTTDVCLILDETSVNKPDAAVVDQCANELPTTPSELISLVAVKSEHNESPVDAEKQSDNGSKVNDGVVVVTDHGIMVTLPDSISNFLSDFKSSDSFSQLVAGNGLGKIGNNGVTNGTVDGAHHLPHGLPSTDEIKKVVRPACDVKVNAASKETVAPGNEGNLFFVICKALLFFIGVVYGAT